MCLSGMLLLLGFGGVILLLVSFAAAAVIRLVYTSTLAAFILSKVAIYKSLLSADAWTLLCGQMCVLITFSRLFKQ